MRKLTGLFAFALMLCIVLAAAGSIWAENPPAYQPPGQPQATPMPNAPGYPQQAYPPAYAGPTPGNWYGQPQGGYMGVYGSGCTGGQGGYSTGCTGGQGGYMTVTTTTMSYGQEAGGCSGGQGGYRRGLFGRRHRVRGGCD